ncbi:MAG TPA: hypothetical protein VF104_05980, partial [Burkholderiales bacterium]
ITFPGTLDRFWKAHASVDRKLFHKFRQFLIHTTQLNGSFYSPRAFDFMSPVPPRALASLTTAHAARTQYARTVSRRRGRPVAGSAGPRAVVVAQAANDESVSSRQSRPPR